MKRLSRLKSDQAYLIALFLYILGCLIVLQWKSPIDIIANYFSIATKMTALILAGLCWLLKIKKLKNKYSLFALFVFVCILISDYMVGNNTVFWTALFVFSGYGVDFKKIVSTYYKAISVSLVILLVAHFLDMTNDVVKNLGYGLGHSWGMAHPNNFGVILFSFTICTVFLFYNDKRKFAIYGLVAIMAIIVQKITVSRTSLYALTLILLGLVALYLSDILKSKWLIRFLRIAVVLIFVGSIYLLFNPNSLNRFSLDSGVTYRFVAAYDLLRNYGVYLFGNRIEFISTIEAQKLGVSNVVLDSAYPALLISHGILVTILYFLLFSFSFKRAYENKHTILLLIMTVCMVHGLMEQSVINVVFNIFLTYLFSKDFEVDRIGARVKHHVRV